MGWAAICVDDNDSVKFKICGGDDQATNNIMELTAVIRGLERFGGGSVTVYTDSKYVMNGITKLESMGGKGMTGGLHPVEL